MSLESFTQAYITCALWSSNDESTPEGGVPLDDNYSKDDIAPKTLQAMKNDCEVFYKANLSLIESEDLRRIPDSDVYGSAGHDFWLTRNGHGAGFWDGDWPIHGEALTLASKAFSEVYLYVGDDGKIHA